MVVIKFAVQKKRLSAKGISQLSQNLCEVALKYLKEIFNGSHFVKGNLISKSFVYSLCSVNQRYHEVK